MEVSEEMVQLVVVPVLLLCVTAIIVALRIAKAIERRSLAALSSVDEKAGLS